jgi:hypothetical protein
MSLLRRIATHRTFVAVVVIVLTLPHACGY